MIKLSDYIIRRVAELGVRHVFLLPGGGCMHLVDSLGRNKDLEPVCCLHEQAAAIAADAYSQYTDNVGVCLVTTGPGGTNAITGVAGSWIDSIPVLVISGQVKRQDMIGKLGVRQMGPQEVDIVSIIKPITKYAVTVTDPSSIRYHFEKAIYLAKSVRPGPVWLDIPLDVQGASINEGSLTAFNSSEIDSTEDSNVLNKAVHEAVRLFNISKRPAILAGNGIRSAGALKDFIKLIDALGVPVLTTWKAIDFLPENHRLYFGRPGSVASRGANFTLQNADLIIAVGARLDPAQVGFDYKNFAPAAKKVVVDIDPNELRKIKTKIDLPICADARGFISALLKNKGYIKRKDRSAWLSKCKEWKAKYPVVLSEYGKAGRYVNTYMLIETIARLMKDGDVLVPGSSGGCSELTMQSFKVKKGQRIFNSPGLGAMGFGLPASIGACLASGRKRTITLIGDGGLQHNIQELETVARLKLPLKIFVLNNNGYASIRSTQKTHFKAHYVCCDPSSGLTIPDTRKVAKAYGIKTMKISNHKKLEEQVKGALQKKGPIVCEVIADPFLATAPRLLSEVRPDGSMASKPMEDLWPFLDREELKANMIAKSAK